MALDEGTRTTLGSLDTSLGNSEKNPGGGGGVLVGIDDPEFEQKLLAYYQRLFPFPQIYSWLSYGSQELFHCREFAFWLLPSKFGGGVAGGGDGGASSNHASSNLFVRYQCYETEEQFRKALSQRAVKFGEQTIVERMEIGPIYRTPPVHHAVSSCVPVSREFVIDIDMDDYNGVRNCCQGARVCSRCWAVMTVAVKVIDELLRGQFGFRHLLWVFSGRRGVHCWVSDDAARRMTQAERACIIENLSLIAKKGDSRVDLTDPLLPRFEQLYQRVLVRFFEARVLPEQQLLNHEGTTNAVLAHLPAAAAEALRQQWAKEQDKSSEYRWDQLKNTLIKSKEPRFRLILASIVFEFTYPRFDVKVSEDLNHLLKSPFCVHPKTGFVSIPIDPAKCDSFDPTKNAPSLRGLIAGLDQPGGNVDHLVFEDALSLFQRFLKPLQQEQQLARSTASSAASSASTNRTTDIEDL